MMDPPIINPNWLSDPTDQEIAVQSFKRSREIWSVLAQQGLTVGEDEALPGLNVTSDEDILAYIQNSLMTIYHAAATCKMGKVTDKMAVIDSRARVYGVQNLRVVDASAFPFLPPGHPQSTIYALAEKIVADILGPDVPPPGYSLTGYEEGQALQRNKDGSGNTSATPETSNDGATTLDLSYVWGLLGIPWAFMIWVLWSM